ncbi:MAG: formylglycine-generating enzyme family protein [Thermoguttaceae bacterium]|nr:formylglycine-generating enzyme family protein [Thermoguttaceae bacterium]
MMFGMNRRFFRVIVSGVGMVISLGISSVFAVASDDWRTPDAPSSPRCTPEELAAAESQFAAEVSAAQTVQQAAQSAKLPLEWQNAYGMTFRLIPAGTFEMGSPAAEEGRKKYDWCGDETSHSVTISRPFYMMTTEVTQSQWTTIMGDNPSKFAIGGELADAVKGLDTAHFPVENVSWDDVQTFIQKLSTQPDEMSPVATWKKADGQYGLPTESQWEYACRAGTTGPFGMGVILNGEQANMDGREPYGTDQAGPFLNRPTDVASYTSNAWGIFDMHGNVWEWCADGWANDLGTAAVTDPFTATENILRVDRGGSFDNIPALCRSAHRGSYEKHRHSGYVGFRLIFQLPKNSTSEK